MKSKIDTSKKQARIKKVVVDRDLCIGAATCAAIGRKAFKIDKENKAVVLKSWTKEETKILIDAAKSCPVNAIKLIDEEGKQVWPPK